MEANVETGNEHPLVSGLSAVAIFAILVSVVASAVVGWSNYWDFLKGPASAWVGALGSVGAIWGSLKAARYQHEKQLEQAAAAERELRRRQLFTLHSLVQYAEAIALKVRWRTQPGNEESIVVAQLLLADVQQAGKQLDQLPTYLFAESPMLVESLAVASTAMNILRSELQGIVVAREFGAPPLLASISANVHNIASHLTNCGVNTGYALQYWDNHGTYPPLLTKQAQEQVVDQLVHGPRQPKVEAAAPEI